MSLRVRYAAPEPGMQLGYSVERLSDGAWFDFATTGPTAGQFSAAPQQSIAPLPVPDVTVPRRHAVTLNPTPAAQWTDGAYCVTVHNTAAAGNRMAMACLQARMTNGDDQPGPAAGLGGPIHGTFTPGP